MRATDIFGSRLTPPGFYYKTFIRPRRLWPLYEKVLRHAAGLGRLRRRQAEREWRTEYRRRHADVLVIGGGVAGMAAALRASRAGRRRRPGRRRPRARRQPARRSRRRRRRRAARAPRRDRGRGPGAGRGARLLRRDRPGLVREHPAPGSRRAPRRRHRLDRAAADVRGQRPARGDALLRRRATRRASTRCRPGRTAVIATTADRGLDSALALHARGGRDRRSRRLPPGRRGGVARCGAEGGRDPAPAGPHGRPRGRAGAGQGRGDRRARRRRADWSPTASAASTAT